MKFGLPNEDRTWEEYFIGQSDKEQLNQKRVRLSYDREKIELDFTEGTDELCLIEGAETQPSPTKNSENDWEEADNDLLRVLYVEKGCSLDTLSVVFKTTVEVIYKELKRIGLID